jgi:hypothetical protein
MINLKCVVSEVGETKSDDRLERWCSLFVKILSTFIGICYPVYKLPPYFQQTA